MYAFGATVTLLTRTRDEDPDADGNDTFTSASLELTNVPIQSRSSVELVQGQDTLATGYLVLLPTGTAVAATDRIVWDGDTYEIDGKPDVLRSFFTGWAPGVLVTMNRVTG